MSRSLAAVLAVPSLAVGGALHSDQLEPILAMVDGGGLCFVELRESALLETPVEVRGRLLYVDDVLIKEIVAPARERMELTAERFSLQSEQRRLDAPLGRAPALRALRLAITALLRRDPATLQSLFDVAVSGTAETAWRIDLRPRERSLTRSLDSVWIAGRRGGIEEIGLIERGGERQLMRIVGTVDGLQGECSSEPD